MYHEPIQKNLLSLRVTKFPFSPASTITNASIEQKNVSSLVLLHFFESVLCFLIKSNPTFFPGLLLIRCVGYWCLRLTGGDSAVQGVEEVLSAMFTVSQNRMISHVLIILLFPTGFNCTTSPLITPLEVSLICLKEDIPEGCRHCNWSQALAGVFARSGVIHLSTIHLFKGWDRKGLQIDPASLEHHPKGMIFREIANGLSHIASQLRPLRRLFSRGVQRG